MKTGALIVASRNLDYKIHDNEEASVLMPMMHLDGTTVIKREIAQFRRAGISPIVVVCGYQQEILRNHLSHNGVLFCEDPDFEKHSYEETRKVGMEFIGELCDRWVVHPVEYPVFAYETLEKMLTCEDSITPVFQGEQGYPRLHVKGAHQLKLEVDDPGITYCLTDEGGYEKITEYARQRREENALSMHVKVILGKEEDFFGPGVYHLLRKIGETGSMQKAAAELGISYTKCWKMVNRVEDQMGFRFLNRVNGGKHGGRSSLTPEAMVFLDRYNALREDIRRMSQNFFDLYFSEFQ